MKISNKAVTGVLVVLAIVAVAALTIVASDNDNRVIESIRQKAAPEMAQCWNEVAETGGNCDLQIIYSSDGSPVTYRINK